MAARDLPDLQVRFTELRDRLHAGLVAALGAENVRLNGHPELRLPNTLSLSFRSVPANLLLEQIGDRVAASAGSACHADSVTVSGVLAAMQVPLEYAMGTIRFSVGRGTTEPQIDQAIPIIADAVRCQINNL
jgi:cysteine desulfurase